MEELEEVIKRQIAVVKNSIDNLKIDLDVLLDKLNL